MTLKLSPPKYILHIATDDKFIDMAFQLFEKVSPKCNKLVVLSNDIDLKYVSTEKISGRTHSESLELSKDENCDLPCGKSMDPRLYGSGL